MTINPELLDGRAGRRQRENSSKHEVTQRRERREGSET
jgi:hypothetical protein